MSNVLLFAVQLAVVAVAVTAAAFARRYMQCARVAAASGLAAASRSVASSPAGRPPAPAGEYWLCRNCDEVIERSPDGWAVPYIHEITRAAGCRPELVAAASWAEPSTPEPGMVPERWVAEALAIDYDNAAADAAAAELEDGRPRCRHCNQAIEANTPLTDATQHSWRHVLGGPACWLQNGARVAALFGKTAEPRDQDHEPGPEDVDKAGADARAVWALARHMASQGGGVL